MFSHPATILGYMITAGGWLFLLFGVNVGGYGLARDVVNIHLLQIANGVVWLGYFLILTGVVAVGLHELRRVLAFLPDIRDALAKEKEETEGKLAEEIARASVSTSRLRPIY